MDKNLSENFLSETEIGRNGHLVVIEARRHPLHFRVALKELLDGDVLETML
jgi:hypothetical protein